MLTGTVGIPSGPGPWLIEPKWDGVRAMVTVEAGTVNLTSRNGNDVTLAYPELVALPPGLREREVVLDGEVVAIADDGRPSFGRLQQRMHVRNPPDRLVADVPVNLIVFDLLWDSGTSLLARPLTERRERLGTLDIAPWTVSPFLDLPLDAELIDTGRDLGLEGFVIKRADAPYQPGRRSEAWAKVKCVRRREFVVGGWSEGKGGRAGALGSLALGVHVDGRLRFVGMAGSGLRGADIDAFRRLASALERPTSPFSNPVPAAIRFLDPVVVAEVRFSEVTAAGTLRHPVLLGFRTDVAAGDVGLDGELPELPPSG